MNLCRNGVAAALVAGAIVASISSSEAAFFAAPLSDPTILGVGAGGGKNQANVSGLAGDVFLGIFDDLGSASASTVLTAVQGVLGSGVSVLTSVGDGGRLDDSNGFPLAADPGCTTGCTYDVGSAFAYYVIKYDGLHALFQNDGDTSLEYTLGAGNYGTSNATILTPVPAALPLLLTALGGMGLIARRKSSSV